MRVCSPCTFNVPTHVARHFVVLCDSLMETAVRGFAYVLCGARACVRRRPPKDVLRNAANGYHSIIIGELDESDSRVVRLVSE